MNYKTLITIVIEVSSDSDESLTAFMENAKEVIKDYEYCWNEDKTVHISIEKSNIVNID